MISRGKADARKLAHARVLLQADASEGGPDWTDTRIAEAVRVSVRTIERVWQGVGLPTGCQGLNGCGRDTPWHLRTRAWSWSQ